MQIAILPVSLTRLTAAEEQQKGPKIICLIHMGPVDVLLYFLI